MEMKHYFKLNLADDFERRFQRLNFGEYLVKFTAVKGSDNGGVFTIEFKNVLPLSVEMKLYEMENNEDEEGCVFSCCSVLQSNNMKFEADLKHISYDCRSYICLVEIYQHQELKNIQDSAKENSVTKNAIGSVTESRLDQLSSDMRRLLAEGELSDVVVSNGSRDFRAHKAVLSARSSVFCQMFQHSVKENCENRVTISDVSSEVLEELLTFIYTGVTTIKDMKMARDLYMVAHMYDMKELQAVCSKKLKDVNIDNVIDILALADLYRDETLKQSALEFIAENYSELKRHKRWNSFIKENQVLAVEVSNFAQDKNV